MTRLELDSRDDLILVTEQAAQAVQGRGSDGRLLWTWRPGGRTAAWGLPNDAKVRCAPDGRSVLLMTDSYGFAGAVREDGSLLWATDVGTSADPHSIEMLPDGRVAVAGNRGGWVRLFGAVRDVSQPKYRVTVALDGAHGLVWRSDDQLLWALGDKELVGLAPLPDDHGVAVQRSYRLPGPEGHDLRSAASYPGCLWVTTRTGVHLFDLRRRDWRAPEEVPLNRERNVKSISDTESGRILLTTATSDEEWWTSRLRFEQPSGVLELDGTRVYKARWAKEATL